RPSIRKLLDPVVAAGGGVRDENVPGLVHGDPLREIELPSAAAKASPRGKESPGVRELLDAGVVAVSDEDIPAPIDGNAIRALDLPGPAAQNPNLTRGGPGLEGRHAVRHPPAEGEEEGPGIRELLDALILDVRSEDVPVPIHREAIGADVELAIPA